MDIEAKLKKEKRKLKEKTLWRVPPDKELRPVDTKLPSTNLPAMWAILKADPQTPVKDSDNCSPSQKKKKKDHHQLNCASETPVKLTPWSTKAVRQIFIIILRNQVI